MTNEEIYAEAQAILAGVTAGLETLNALQKRALAVIDPAMSVVLNDGFSMIEAGAQSISTVLTTTFGGTQVTPETIDAAARAAVKLKFPDK